MAFDMIDSMSKIKIEGVSSIKLRIGIHYGKVIAGVIGYHKPQFSLIGDTVNTTSRVASKGYDGKINISSEAYDRVKNSELFFEPYTIKAKGKGQLTNYVVEKTKF